MRSSTLLVVGIWVWFLLSSVMQGLMLPGRVFFSSPMPESLPWILLISPFVFFFPAAFLQRHKTPELGFIRRLVDWRFGEGAYRGFMTRLRPTFLLLLCAGSLGVLGLLSTHFSTRGQEAYLGSGFFTSASLGLGAAYLLSIRFPPKLW